MIPEKIMKIGVIIINLENAPTAKLVLGKGMGTWDWDSGNGIMWVTGGKQFSEGTGLSEIHGEGILI